MKIKEVLEYGRNNLIEKEEPVRLSKILLKNLMRVEDSYLLIHEDEEVLEEIQESFKEQIELLNAGKPLQYITNYQEFMKLDFYVDEKVLIPQPDTEIIVEEVISLCKNRKEEISILDLCTGSGAIGITLAKYIENSKVIMSDISYEALEVAKENAERNKVIEKCTFVESNLFERINEKFNIIVSNPPYIQTEVIKTLEKEVQEEPMLALDGGKDGLDFYRRIAKEVWRYLKQDGILALEIGYNQKEKVIELLEKEDKYKEIIIKQDLAGNDRVILCRLK